MTSFKVNWDIAIGSLRSMYGKTLQEVSKILPGSAEDEVSIFLTDNHIVFEFENTTVVSRLIEGEYFKIEQMLSSDYETKVKINKRELLDCIDRATLLVKEGDKKPIIMNITDGTMELKINSFIGSMNEDIDIAKEGKDILIGFNPKFFIDALRVIDEEEVTLYMVNPKAPLTITRPSWMTNFASTPDSTSPAFFKACPSFINSSVSLIYD